MRSETRLSVVIPVYRSEGYLAKTVAELVRVFEREAQPFEIVLVNDGSPDAVQEVIERLCAADPRIRGVALGRNVGQHQATLHGFLFTKGDVVVTVDDDGQNPPEGCLAVARALVDRRLDVVYGRFEVVEQARHRRFASAVNRWISSHTIGNTGGLAVTNVRAIRGDLARALGAAAPPFPYIDALLFRATRHLGEVPVPHRPRAEGESTYRLGTLFRLALSHFTTLTVLPLRVATAGSFAASALGLVLGLAQLVRVLIERRAPAGWLSLFCAITFLFSVLFAFLGIVSMYLGRLYVSFNSRGLLWTRSISGDPAGPAPEQRGAGAPR